MITGEIERRVTGFLRSLADTCKECHFDGAACTDCPALVAKGIGRDIFETTLAEDEPGRGPARERSGSATERKCK